MNGLIWVLVGCVVSLSILLHLIARLEAERRRAHLDEVAEHYGWNYRRSE